MFVYVSEQQLRNNDFRGPDVFVVLDVEDKGRKSWVAWEEGGRATRYRNYEQPFVRWLDLSGAPLPTAQERAEVAERRVQELEQWLAAAKG